MKTYRILLILLLAFALASCEQIVPPPAPTPLEPTPGTPLVPTPTPLPEAPTPTAVMPTPQPDTPSPAPDTPAPVTPTATPEITPTPTIQPLTPAPPQELPLEPIMILEPGPGSRILSPITIRGEADPTFEQNLGIRVFLADGTLLTESFATIAAELGERGPFETEVEFEIEGEENAFIQVYDASARDGEITQLSSVGVILASQGEEEIVQREPHYQRVVIFSPAAMPLQVVSGGTVRVEGFGLAGFEQTLNLEVQDEMGNVVGETFFMVDAPDLGFPGPFEAEVDYQIDAPQRGRIVIRDLSPAFGGEVYVTSVEVELEP